jgi:hypothetical protein
MASLLNHSRTGTVRQSIPESLCPRRRHALTCLPLPLPASSPSTYLGLRERPWRVPRADSSGLLVGRGFVVDPADEIGCAAVCLPLDRVGSSRVSYLSQG